ncbi:MAG: formate/nitrite transporter family protein [Lachnospiraceae bacterium]|nr:formate/nitrite transporter family protein [Lachnospiraceae bacterium]
MENSFYTPAEVVELNMKGSENKANLPLRKMILLGIMAGMFIALGGATSNTAVHNIENVGLARALAGAIFPVGLMMIVFVGGELFTGNCLIIMDVFAKRVSLAKMLRNLAVVYLSNLVGALFVDILIFYSGNLKYTDCLLGAYTIKVAIGKIAVTPVSAITSGILCNVLVCIAILMAAAAKDIVGKIWAIFFPIWAFVIGGFEHCVANMFYIPMGMLAAKNADYAAKAQEVYGITAEQLASLNIIDSLANFIPVTIGNMLGGMLVVGGLCFKIYKGSHQK